MSAERGQIRERSLVIAFPDGGMLTVVAIRPRGARGHGEEAVKATVRGPDGSVAEIEEALVSAQYDEAGLPRRVTLELWPDAESEQPLRGAGTSVEVDVTRGDGTETATAFFHWSVEGREGAGPYEVVRDA